METDAEGRYSFDWGDRPDSEDAFSDEDDQNGEPDFVLQDSYNARFRRQAKKLMKKIQSNCKTGEEEECQNAARALTFLHACDSGRPGALRFIQRMNSYARPTGEYLEGALDSIINEIDTLLSP